MLIEEEILAIFVKLVNSITVVSEIPSRREILRNFMELEGREVTVNVLRLMLDPPAEHSDNARILYNTASELFIFGGIDKCITYDVLSGLYIKARELGFEQVARFLITPPPAKVMSEGERPILHTSLSGTTLGMRRSMAKGQKKFMLDHLMRDTDPVVIRNILRNPRIVEADVIKLASKRPVDVIVLKEIYRSPRWNKNYRVRKALIFNPYNATEISIKLIPSLIDVDLRLCVFNNTLHKTVRETAVEELKRRGTTVEAPDISNVGPVPQREVAVVAMTGEEDIEEVIQEWQREVKSETGNDDTQLVADESAHTTDPDE